MAMSVSPKLSTEAVWRGLSADLRRFIRRRVSDDHVADDLLQETFVRIHRGLDALQEAKNLAAWVFQIARNVIRDHHRRAASTPRSLADVDVAADGDAFVSEVAEGGGQNRRHHNLCQGADWLNELIRSLPEGYRVAVQLAEIDGLAHRDVATRLDLSLSGAKSRVQRGRALLKESLEQCCRFEFDVRGNAFDCAPRPGQKTCHRCSE
jgi:RNA polymerase sigma-70 factor (ECF subfamily)